MRSSLAPLLSLIASLTLVLGLYVLVKRYQEVLLRDSLVSLGQAQASVLEENRALTGHGADFSDTQSDYPSRWFLLSDYGFPDSQTAASFVYERQRLAAQTEELAEPLFDFLTTPLGEIFWFATPLLAEESCVSCHNNHPNSPRTDWKIGDLMGAQVLTLPVTNAGRNGSNAFRDIIIFLSIFFTVAILATLFSQSRSQHALRTIQQREAESRLLSMVAAKTDNGVMIVNPNGATEWVNDGYTRMTGFSLEEASYRAFHELLVAGKTEPEISARIEQALENAAAFSEVTMNRTKDGRDLWSAVDCQPIFDEQGRLSNFIAILRDITNLKEREVALETARQAAEEANKSKSQFLANMSHEIRTPMNGIIGMTQLMLQTVLGKEQRHYANTIRVSGEALLEIVNDILDFSKIDAGQIELVEAPFNLAAVLNGTVEILSPRALQKGLDLSVEMDPSLDGVYLGDKGRLRQILLNLVNNAVKFTDTGSVKLIVQRGGEPDVITVRIVDTGIGIPSDRLNDVFQSFSQIDASASRRYEGTGLGLSISQQLVEAMGGTIGVESIEGQGSTFWFTLPLTAASSDEEPMPDVVPSVPLHRQTGLRPLHVLVAEDNIINQQVARGFLERLGHHVTIAANGREAVETIQSGTFDMVFMDIQMPEMDGLEATTVIRSLPSPLCDIPIIAMTANAMKSDQENCLAHGMNDHLAKPILIEQLRDTIERWFGEVFEPEPTETSNTDDQRPEPMDIDPAIQKQLFEQLGAEMLNDILSVFSSDTDERLALIQDAQATKTAETIAKQAHSIKGSAASLGLMTVVQRAADLEREAQKGEWTSIESHIASLRRSKLEFDSWLKERFAR